jgi:hypothetical protein
MRSRLQLAVLLALVTSAAILGAPVDPDPLMAHIRYLSSDELQGRGNGTEGLERAAEYIATQFRQAGLEPGGTGGSWFQPFEMVAGIEINPGNELTFSSAGRTVRLTLGSSYYPLAVTPSDSTAAPSQQLDGVPLVFAGYGISSRNPQYDDYAGLDVRGKAVVIFSHEPQENLRTSRLNGNRPLRETTLLAKAEAARTRGAVALFVIADPSHSVDDANYKLFTIDADTEDHAIPVVRIAREPMQPLIDAWGLEKVADAIERDLMPRSGPLAGATVDYSERLSRKRRTVRNVVGVLRGSDPARAGEAIVIGGHYDHVGLGGRYSSTPERTGEIHNGADDNASGTAAVIEIARTAMAERARFPRSLVFAAFAGEERGLLGSEHYAMSPVIPIQNTVAMINLDMVGRANGRVEVNGLGSAPALVEDVEAAAKVAGLTYRRSNIGPGRSDDAPFLDKRIPALHLFTGFHNDYHRPTDDVARIDGPGTARVATMALELAARVAARADRPRMVP